MKHHAKFILCILTLVAFFMPMLQGHLRLFEFKELTGVVEEDPKPELTLSHVTDQSLQQWTERYLRLHYGFREPLTRLYNQFRWDFFGKSNTLGKNRNYISDDGWLYEGTNVEEYYQGRFPINDSAALIRYYGEEALRLYQIQQILDSHGTKLFVLLLPGKELIYPEHLPQTEDFPGHKKISTWEFYGKRLQELGVNHINVGQWFLDIKDTVDYPLYPQTGTHWSNYAVMHVADSIIHYMEWLDDIQMEHFTIGEREERTVYPDDDLEQLMNLARPLSKAPNYYAPYTILSDSTAIRPTLITIGDSYYWNLLNATPFGKVMGDFKYWYYFSTVYFDDEHDNVKDLDVLQEVLDADFVMLAYSTPQLYKMSGGFSQQLLMEICCNEEEIEAAQKRLVNDIRNNFVWMEGLVKIAEQYNLSLDTVVNGEAKNSILKHPNRYIPALKDSIPTQRSRKFLIDINRHNEEVVEIIDVIKQTPQWYDAVVKQADERHLSLDDNLYLNAIYFLEHRRQ